MFRVCNLLAFLLLAPSDAFNWNKNDGNAKDSGNELDLSIDNSGKLVANEVPVEYGGEKYHYCTDGNRAS